MAESDKNNEKMRSVFRDHLKKGTFYRAIAALHRQNANSQKDAVKKNTCQKNAIEIAANQGTKEPNTAEIKTEFKSANDDHLNKLRKLLPEGAKWLLCHTLIRGYIDLNGDINTPYLRNRQEGSVAHFLKRINPQPHLPGNKFNLDDIPSKVRGKLTKQAPGLRFRKLVKGLKHQVKHAADSGLPLAEYFTKEAGLAEKYNLWEHMKTSNLTAPGVHTAKEIAERLKVAYGKTPIIQGVRGTFYQAFSIHDEGGEMMDALEAFYPGTKETDRLRH